MPNIQQCPKCDSIMTGDETGHLTCPNCSLYLNIAFLAFITARKKEEEPHEGELLASYGIGS